MIIDVTTKNKIYNPTSAQGQWFQHRWGKRSYDDIDLSWKMFTKAVKNTNDPIMLISEYGDPVDWKYLESACKLCKENLTIYTYGMFNQKQVDTIKKYGCRVIIVLDGLSECGRVHLNADISIIKENIYKLYKQCLLQFKCFRHNLYEIPIVIKDFKQRNMPIQFVKGRNVDGVLSSIISEKGEWLYDVHCGEFETTELKGKDLDWVEEKFKNTQPEPLHKTVIGYNLLRTYMRKNQKRNIFERPMICKETFQETHKKSALKKITGIDMISVSPTGHVFYNSTLFAIFMRLLSRDWSLSKNDVINFHQNSYALDVLYQTQYLHNMNLDELLMNFNLPEL